MKSHKLATAVEKAAMAKYHAQFESYLFTAAIKGKTTEYANALIDEAMAMSGSPYYKLSNRNWSMKASAFLFRFAIVE